MKKLMALCLSLLMALSMVSFSVMAEEAAVDFSAIANGQPANFVTSNLVLGTNTITSSNEAVIKADGTVARPIYDDATVTLTINGGAAFDVTVKAKTTNVLYANDFSAALGSEWKLNAVGSNTPSAVADGKLYMNIASDTSAGRTNLYYNPAAISGTRPVTMAFDMSDVVPVSSGADIRISGNRYDADGNVIGSFNTITISRCNSTGGFGNTAGTSPKKNVSITYDPTTGVLTVNGTAFAQNLFTSTATNFVINEGHTTDEVASVKITSFCFCNAGGSVGAEFKMDNFAYYEEVSEEEALASATPAEKLASYSSVLDEAYVANGGNLGAVTGNLNFTADELPADASLTWTSTNPAIATDGTVKRPILEAETATITGTLKVGEESISKSYNVTLLPLTIAGQSETVNFDAVGSVSDFTIISGGSGAVVTEAGNKVGSFTYSGGMNTYATYNFKTLPSLTNAEELIMEFKLRTENHSTAGTSNVTNYGFLVNGKEIAEFINHSGTVRVNNTYNGGASGNAWHGSGGSSVAYNTNSANYANFKIVIDVANKTAKHYWNENQLGTSTVGIGLASLDSITSIAFYLADRSSGATIYVDDINVYTTQSLDSVISTLSDADKVDFYKQLIEASDIGTATSAGAVLDLDNGYAEYAPATYGVAVNWASGNTAYIANDGTVAKLAPYGENVTVNMTATITAGSASDTVVIPVTIADVTTVDTTSHYNYDFSDYTVPEGAKYEIVADSDAAHGNVLKLDSTVSSVATLSPGGTYGFGGRSDRFIIETDFKYDENSKSFPYFRFGTPGGANGMQVNIDYLNNRIGIATTNPKVSGYNFELITDTSAYTSNVVMVYYDMPASVLANRGQWSHLMVDYNVLSQTYQVTIDGNLINEIPDLVAYMKKTNGGGTLRGIHVNHNGAGIVYIDNLTIKDYDDANVVEVNAALNSALNLYASEHLFPVLTNRTLWDKTISHSWNLGSSFDMDDSNLADNPARYKVMEDSPALTYKVDGVAATAINVVSPTEAEITITATKNGYSESKTFQRKLAPVAIRDLSLGTADCLNGAWIEGAAGTEKVIAGYYSGDAFVTAKVFSLADAEKFDSATGFLMEMSIPNPKESADYDQIKLFIVDANGITPLAYADASLKD